jgi:hypothetical protein
VNKQPESCIVLNNAKAQTVFDHQLQKQQSSFGKTKEKRSFSGLKRERPIVTI